MLCCQPTSIRISERIFTRVGSCLRSLVSLDTISCPLGLPLPLEGLGLVVTQTHVGAGTRALLGPRASASRRRALRGAAQGGADVVSRFPLLAPEARCGALRTPSNVPRFSKDMVSTRLAGAHAGQRQQAPWISASIRISLSNIYKLIETESETMYPTHHCSIL